MYKIDCGFAVVEKHTRCHIGTVFCLAFTISAGCATNGTPDVTESDIADVLLTNDTPDVGFQEVTPDIAKTIIDVLVDTHTDITDVGQVGEIDPSHDTKAVPDTMTAVVDAHDCPISTDCTSGDTMEASKDVGSDTPSAQSCTAFGECLAQFGCDCELNNDCPPTGSVDFESCQAQCAKQPACVESCFQTLEPVTYQRFVALQACAEAKCGDIKEKTANLACLKTHCLSEYAACYHVGDQSCVWLYNECAVGCKTTDCLNKCELQLDAESYVAMVNWDKCRFDLCDNDKNGQLDSNTCNTLVAYTSCAKGATDCIPQAFFGTSTCLKVVTCLGQCSNWTEQTCLSTCLTPAPDAATPLAEVIACVVAHCGTTDAQLTPSCLSETITGPCATPAQNCQ